MISGPGESLSDSAPDRTRHLPLVALCVVTAALYLTLVDAPFLSWDDDKNISLNPYYLHLGWWRIWREPYFGLYVPVTGTVWAALFELGRREAWIFRAFNVVLHVANTVLVFRLVSLWLERMDFRRSDMEPRFAALIGATVFALHPAQTAAVSWISGGRDLLSAFLALLSVLLYFRTTRWSYLAATTLFALALLSKPSVAAVPLAIIAYTAIAERARLRAVVRHMSVWVLLVLTVAIATSMIQSTTTPDVPLHLRPIVALDALGFYILKLLWPASLSADYGRSPEWLFENPGRAIPTIVTVAGAGALLVWLRRRADTPVAWILIWVLLLAPVLGATTFAYQQISTVADHYLYLPMVAIAGLAAVLAVRFVRTYRVAWATLAVLVVVYATLSWRRTQVWRDDKSLFNDMVQKNPRSFSGLTSLSRMACLEGRSSEGLQLIGRAVVLRPYEAVVLATQAHCLYHADQFDAVVGMRQELRYREVQVGLKNDYSAASSLMNSIAGAYFARGEGLKGWPFLCQAVALKPFDPDLRLNLQDVQRKMSERSIDARCPPSAVPWDEFAAFVSD